MTTGNEIKLVYDRECPVCNFYSHRIEVAEGNLERVDAREESELMNEITAAGLDIDKGMALKVGDSIYLGSDAIHELALRSSGKGFFNNANASVFRFPRAAKILYPVLLACRNLLLKVLGRSRINNLSLRNNDRF